MQFSVYQESRIGARSNNQDRMGYIYTRDAVLLLLADGMGGHVQGEMAAAIAMQTIGKMFQQTATPYIKRPERFLEDCFYAAHRDILRYAESRNLPESPRTTIVACLLQHRSAIWGHCGDSRLYWMRNGQILAQTQDHSRISALIAQGKVDPSQRDTHPERHKLYNCLGSTNQPIVETSRKVSLQAGDVLLLCSDGLWSVLPENMIVRAFRENTVMRAVPELLNRAVTIAGINCDNATALALMWLGENSLTDASTISTNTLQEGETTSMIQNTQPDGGAESNAIDEAEIERAIAEIRGALQKTSGTTKE
ncbi:MAG: PP2C family serine/threonine-protein phosphatase [Burkholderiaceae bacterium]|nr:PP2C family serine/threonine-protein phosphatase [Burkholderiaceae bacterium]